MMLRRVYPILFIFLLFPFLAFSNEIIFNEKEKEWLKNNSEITYSEVNWKPLSIIDDNRMKGIMGDYLDLVTEKTGLKFKFIPSNSWPHVLEQFSQGKIDLVPGVGQSPQELKLGLISKQYAKYPLVIVTTNKYKYLDGLENLEGKTIAVPKYYTSYNFIVKNHPKQKLITTDNIPEALLLVANGKADAFVGHIATSLFYIAETLLSDLKITGKTSFDFEHHYLIQRDNPILLSIINKVFDSISHHERKEIYDKWIQTSVVEEKINYTMLFVSLGIFFIILSALVYRGYLQKKYNKKLKKSHDEMKTIMNSTHEGIIISEGGQIIDANDSALDIFSCSRDKLVGLDILDLVSQKDRKRVLEAFKQEECEAYEINIRLLDGREIPALVKGINTKLERKSVRISSFIDISQLKQQEKFLIEQSNMAAMGEMASTLAHQWRQPLAVINASVSSWKYLDEVGELDRETIFDGVDTVTKKAEYLSETINDFIYLFETDKTSSEFLLEDLIEKLLKAQKSLFKLNKIKVVTDINIKKQIRANEARFKQALFNIINNSVEILQEKEENRIILISIKPKGENVEIIIQDSGGGFKDNVENEIFKPYYSTKDSLNGPGLGLYMSYTIIKKLKGEITASNETFTFEGKEYYGVKTTVTIPF